MTRSTKERIKRWHDKRMRKECNIGDKMLMNSSSKASNRKRRPPQVIYPSSMVPSCSVNEDNILR
jgi:hypothetical protein